LCVVCTARHWTRCLLHATTWFKTQAIIDAALDERQSSIYKKIAAILYPFIGFAPKQSEENVEKNVAALNETLATFESHFLKHGKFVAGDHPSIADLSIGSALLCELCILWCVV